MLSQADIAQVIGSMVANAREQGGRLEFRDETGAVVATLHAHDLPKRPKDMPRALRPKQKLSKRQRAAVKREKLREGAVASSV